MEHQLKAYPLAEPVAHKKRPLTPYRRHALKEEVFIWLKEGIIRKVQYPGWITNAILIKQRSEVDEELVSLMGYQYKCFLRLPKGYNQIRMSEVDEEKTIFHTEEGVYCFTHMPKELKNYATTLQRMMEKVLVDQKGQNEEVYLEEKVVKSRNEQSLIQDIEITLDKLRRVNVKIDLSKCTFKMEEGKFLGYVVIKEGIRVDLEKIQAILRSPTPRGPDQIRSLSLQLANINRFVPKLAGLMHPIRNVRRSLDAEEGSNWTSKAEEALQKIKRRLNKLQALTILKEGEGEEVLRASDKNSKGTSKKFQKEQATTPRAWRLYLASESNKEGMHGLRSTVGQASRFYSQRFWITYLPKVLNIKAEELTGLASIKLELLNQEVSIGIKTRPSVEVKGKRPEESMIGKRRQKKSLVLFFWASSFDEYPHRGGNKHQRTIKKRNKATYNVYEYS
ncbi:hypothetical protein Tco_0868481 [Tanacetum coccineum]